MIKTNLWLHMALDVLAFKNELAQEAKSEDEQPIIIGITPDISHITREQIVNHLAHDKQILIVGLETPVTPVEDLVQKLVDSYPPTFPVDDLDVHADPEPFGDNQPYFRRFEKRKYKQKK